MTRQTIQVTDAIYDYIQSNSIVEPDVFRRLREETAQMENANMQIAAEQGQFMALLAELMGAKRALEIGTFTGYSAMWIASRLPENGKLIALDVNEEWTAIAQRYWKEAGLDHKIELRLAPALESLDALANENFVEWFDFSFVDAVKTEYDDYYEKILPMTRKGGLIAFDNALKGGKVADSHENDESVEAIRALNLKIRDDDRVSSSLAPIGDGLLLAVKR